MFSNNFNDKIWSYSIKNLQAITWWMRKVKYLIMLINYKTLAFCNATQVQCFFYWVPEIQTYRRANIRPLCHLFCDSKLRNKGQLNLTLELCIESCRHFYFYIIYNIRIPAGAIGFSFPPQMSKLLWNPTGLLFNGNRDYFPGYKILVVILNTNLHLASRWTTSWAVRTLTYVLASRYEVNNTTIVI